MHAFHSYFAHQIFQTLKRILFFLPLFSIALVSSCFSPQDELTRKKNLLKAVMRTLENEHYQPLPMNDSTSIRVFNSYLKTLDFQKRFFTIQDYSLFKKMDKSIDNQIQGESFEFYSLVSSVYRKRLTSVSRAFENMLNKPVDLSEPGIVETDAEKRQYPADTLALISEWRDYFRYQIVSSVAIDLEIQEKAKSRKDTVVKMKTVEELEAAAREKTIKNNRDYFKRLLEISEEDQFADYLNSIARSFDPHTDYETPKEKENFDINFTGQFEGIGATLTQRDGFIKVTNIIPGSASWKQGQLKVDDVFLKVAQGEGDPVDVVNMKVDDAIKLIRGKKGTTVKLTVRKPDGSIVVIPIVRDVVVLEETFAKSAILEHDKIKGRFGYIFLPSFYADFSNRGGRNCYEDVKKEIQKLKSEGINQIILDLRNNGGGSLNDVVKIGGLFIDEGPIVQVKVREGLPQRLMDPYPGVDFEGKLLIMTNFFSASASEILAAAMQDYGRAVILGSAQTYGKGTVQKMTDLGGFNPNLNLMGERPSGTVKLTTQKFYRINGGATQLRGVTPDLILPDVYEKIEVGEKELDFVMPWDRTTAAGFTPWNKQGAGKPLPDIRKIRQNSKKRMEQSSYFQFVFSEAGKLKRRQDASAFPLDLKSFQAQQASLKEGEDVSESFNKPIPGFKAKSLQANLEINKSNPAREEVEKGFIQRVAKDYALEEAFRVMAEM
jgi:carboxyl-terminal processing protease